MCMSTGPKTLSTSSRSSGFISGWTWPHSSKTLDFDRLAAGVNFPAKGAKSLPVDFSHVGGLPVELAFGRQIFAMSKGRSVVPHGHDNMATGFLVLKGTFRGRHYDRIEDHSDHYIIRPTLDRDFQPGQFSTISDHKDNVHWFTNQSETGFIFNVHVVETNPENPKRPGRVYVDPLGEKLAGGLIKAPKISYGRSTSCTADRPTRAEAGGACARHFLSSPRKS